MSNKQKDISLYTPNAQCIYIKPGNPESSNTEPYNEVGYLQSSRRKPRCMTAVQVKRATVTQEGEEVEAGQELGSQGLQETHSRTIPGRNTTKQRLKDRTSHDLCGHARVIDGSGSQTQEELS